MAKSIFLYTSLCLLVLFNGCLATQRSWQQQQFNQCQLDRLNALEPNNRIEADAGVIESWDPNDQQFQCVGVAVVRRTIEPNGLLLPHYTNAPQLIYIQRGYGICGTILPSCPNTYQESQQEQGQDRRFQQQEEQDQHQKIQNFKQGDIIALPAGVAHWLYNDDESEVVAVTFLDTNNQANQLDENPRHFYLAGNPEDEFQLQDRSPRGQRQRRLQQQGQGRDERRRHQQHGQGNNVFSGFRTANLAEIFNVHEDTIRNLQGLQKDRGNIVRVKGRLQVARPPRENIHDPSRANIYNPEAGRISTLNSHNLPVLHWLQLSAEFRRLHRDATRLPTRVGLNRWAYENDGENENENSSTDELWVENEIGFGWIVKRASSEGFEWVAFKTNDNAQISPLAGQTSVLRAIPVDVLANAFQLRKEDISELKLNLLQQEDSVIRPSRSSSQTRAIA
ncbi:hypothetical protein CMV_023785 [Castanea mollissima]|uniref:Cupin type-1 domain-containing protein n=1 Tax=Castanea mollissima TaxID=60419 RepID=A0A8J4QSJ7_9ROSI|nr:hypothetical protein CMV_023785 [Castanea mollissima]